jgi:6-phosphogluconolactonase
MPTLTTRRFATRAALEAALIERLAAAIAARQPGALMLSGGSTPLPAYRALGARPLTAAATLAVLFTDDRYVPKDSPSSNYCQSRPLLDALKLPEARLLRVRTELPLTEAAADYERRLDGLISTGVDFGLGLLGLGADGHTASLFSSADLERARGHRAIAVQRPDGLSAVSVTPELLARVREPVFVTAGAGKRAAVAALLARDPKLIAWVAVQGCASVELWMDEEAAAQAAEPAAPS